MTLLLGTCAILFIAADPLRLSAETRRIFTDPSSQRSVSPISLADLVCLNDRGRIRLPECPGSWMRRHVAAIG
jgi:PIN domain nuclease of toxin-antitoxin system